MSGRDVTLHKKWSFPLRISKISWTHHAPSFRWSALETKRWNLGLTLRPHTWIKQGISHLATSLLSNLSCLAISLPPPPHTFPKLPPHYLPTSPTVTPHYSPTFPTLPPYSTHTPFPLSQLPTLPSFPAPSRRQINPSKMATFFH